MKHISLAFAAALVSSTFALADTPMTPAEAEKIKAALHLLYPFIRSGTQVRWRGPAHVERSRRASGQLCCIRKAPSRPSSP